MLFVPEPKTKIILTFTVFWFFTDLKVTNLKSRSRSRRRKCKQNERLRQPCISVTATGSYLAPEQRASVSVHPPRPWRTRSCGDSNRTRPTCGTNISTFNYCAHKKIYLINFLCTILTWWEPRHSAFWHETRGNQKARNTSATHPPFLLTTIRCLIIFFLQIPLQSIRCWKKIQPLVEHKLINFDSGTTLFRIHFSSVHIHTYIVTFNFKNCYNQLKYTGR